MNERWIDYLNVAEVAEVEDGEYDWIEGNGR